jgi:hypothetical protein
LFRAIGTKKLRLKKKEWEIENARYAMEKRQRGISLLSFVLFATSC